ncbi:hypothetical protein K1T71_008609 [Dendrolimus kikuchii]|uniref:Uncharacterized protein n=1 Tax=Dendrolimus kikuchii TaxID=765133 RepID=A0ACC1CV87_9NEOP|nr:hypothetical protein K1T71_008609 [Dendrolimus kikuchii]
MNDAKLYQKSNSLQKRDTLLCLEENIKKIRWQSNSRILDIGCADGSVTKYLKYYIPKDFNKLVGCDISEKMVRFANRHNDDERTSFIVFNIEGEMVDDMMGAFDHVFSFYTVHWIKNQEKAFRNIFNLLTEQGDCLLLFVGQIHIFDIYRILAARRKWSEWLIDVDRYISPYHDSLNPAKEIRQMMESIGFQNIDVRCEDATYTYKDINIFKKSVKAVNPFNIPEGLFEDFMKDYIEVIEEMNLIDKINNNVNISFNYKLIVVYASKST